ncbi:MAG: SMP-30/gluconolactonase/LRE family protein [Anaerolineaceae bacterium]|nr:SMP-30/gluconolactonase/LRE family protein [Anaerolineaceae bacterium]
MPKNVNKKVAATGRQSPEGPSFDREGILFFVDWDAKCIYRLDQEGKLTEFVNTGGVPTGSKFHKNGDLYVADGDLGILIIKPDGTMQVAASAYDGVKFRGPNDLVFASNGDLYFTDPKGSDPDHPIGNVYILRGSGEVELFAGGFQFPNGIVFSDDGKTLFLAETYPNHVLAFEIDENGHEKARRVFAKLEGGLGPDGMAFGKDGNLYVAHFGKGVVAVIDPNGVVISELELGNKNPTNVAFWGGDLYVTEVEGGQVIRLDLGVEGQELIGLT